MATSRPLSVLTQDRGSTASICCRSTRQTARQNQRLLAGHDFVPSQCGTRSCRLPMLGKQVGLKIAHPATDKQCLCAAPWREQRAEEVPDGGSSRCPAPLRPCTTSTSTSLPPIADDAVSPIPRGSGDLRQRRHGSRPRPLPRVALWANQRSWEGSATPEEPRRQQLHVTAGPCPTATYVRQTTYAGRASFMSATYPEQRPGPQPSPPRCTAGFAATPPPEPSSSA
jgi:hypothetical protein